MGWKENRTQVRRRRKKDIKFGGNVKMERDWGLGGILVKCRFV